MRVAVVGAGAAGISASRTLRAGGAEVVVLEAAGRVGGRARTDGSLGWPVDLGATWLHSADENPLAVEAERLGFTLGKRPTRRRVFLDAAGRWAEPEETQALDAFLAACDRAILIAGQAERDVAVAEVLPADPVWSPYMAWWVTAYTGAEPEDVSALDWVRYRDTGHNWPLLEGYGALLVRLAESEPVRLSTPVHEIDWSGAGVRLETPAGTLEADAAIVTVPTGQLIDGPLRFRPTLPPATRDAAGALPLGRADKIVLAFDGDPFGEAEPLFVRAARAGFQIGSFGRSIASGYVGGNLSSELEAEGEAGMIAFALDALAAMFGGEVRRRFRRGIASMWQSEPWIGGAYSAALPGGADMRAVLAEPVGDRLWLAGEAVDTDFHTTAHGAWLSGERAARAVLARGLLIPPPPPGKVAAP